MDTDIQVGEFLYKRKCGCTMCGNKDSTSLVIEENAGELFTICVECCAVAQQGIHSIDSAYGELK